MTYTNFTFANNCPNTWPLHDSFFLTFVEIAAKASDMDDDNPEEREALKSDRLAERLAKTLTELLPDRVLTNHQNALLLDTIGLLNGIAAGRLTVGQARIRNNLVEIYSQFDKKIDDPSFSDVRLALMHALEQGAYSGITIEGHNLVDTGKWRGRP